MARVLKPRIGDTVYGSRTLKGAAAEVLRLNVSRGMRERQEWEEQLRALARRPGPDEAPAMREAMKAVEHRIVRGLWVLEISQPSDGPRRQAKHGIEYMNDDADVHARYTDAAGGKWEAPDPRPAVPSSREIDAANEARQWLSLLPDSLARLLGVAALTKRGHYDNQVRWGRVRNALPECRGLQHSTLLGRYNRALRTIVAELTLKSVGQ